MSIVPRSRERCLDTCWVQTVIPGCCQGKNRSFATSLMLIRRIWQSKESGRRGEKSRVAEQRRN